MTPNMKSFEARVSRIEKAHGKGHGFEAPDTQAGSTRRKDRRPLNRYFYGALIVLALGFCAKAGLYHQLGPEAYGAQVASLGQGSEYEAYFSAVVAADLPTRLIAEFIAAVFPETPVS